MAIQAKKQMEFYKTPICNILESESVSCSVISNSSQPHGILQARILEWVVFSFSRDSSQLRDRTQVSHIAGRFITSWATRDAQEHWSG